jgi:hypothetical protein
VVVMAVAPGMRRWRFARVWRRYCIQYAVKH